MFIFVEFWRLIQEYCFIYLYSLYRDIAWKEFYVQNAT